MKYFISRHTNQFTLNSFILINEKNLFFCHYRLDENQLDLVDKQTSFEDRYYNNQNFYVCWLNKEKQNEFVSYIQNEYPINNEQINDAAIKIQQNFRAYKAKQNVEEMNDVEFLFLLESNKSMKSNFVDCCCCRSIRIRLCSTIVNNNKWISTWKWCKFTDK